MGGNVVNQRTQSPTAPKSYPDNRRSPTHPAAHPQPVAYEQPHYSDTRAEFPVDPPPVSSAPRYMPPAAAPDLSPPPQPSATHPSAHSSTALGCPPSVASCPTHTHTERYPDPHCSRSTAAHTSGTPHASHPHRTSQTPPTGYPAESPPPATAAAAPQPSVESSHPCSSSE